MTKGYKGVSVHGVISANRCALKDEDNNRYENVFIVSERTEQKVDKER